ncbi:hypothetical protein [Salinimicrobium sediminilitoris]|uniref:hypothetical protein n=1 Tax=Salinimicrobium sediminilitoris TaxID=2876715 RepID=UPI001E57FDE1|nr:hypothetical protein [Salinimicrobium sediminilitoris]MCC8360169.1 hypothetical protein [Salinimicrobium sediminilitoris]
MKKQAGIESVPGLLWIGFGLMGGFSFYLKENYLLCGLSLLVAILHGYKLFKTQREKARDRDR